ncbi:MAG TPA: sigma-54 dependent transcriptional regulator [Longimicrobiales bacterium]|nr:sigma-54 dependent transcriptional regulator [Longimicrobiales bacterium]
MDPKILLVEDDDAHRVAIERHLSRSSWDVTAVEDAERALGALSSTAPALVLTDVRMPGMSGIELLDRIRESTGTPVIVMTAFGDMQGAIDAMKKGAFDYLTKPLDLDVLDESLERCLREHSDESSARVDPAQKADVEGLIGHDPRMISIYKTIGSVAGTRTPILIRGETGTGKELIARTIHRNGPDPGQPFVAINCTAVPESLLESELFGHVRGSFTGAVADRKGRFELAGSGTIFLDEIGDTSLAFQAKLLRVLQEREFYPIGGEKPRRTEARVVAATHRTIERMVEEGSFREDLYFRLRVVEVAIPPLRERRADIPLLTRYILGRVSRDLGRHLQVAAEVLDVLLGHDWPGNVRELENALTRAAVLARGSTITAEHLSLRSGSEQMPDPDDQSLDAMERAHVQRVLAQTRHNKSRAAQILGVSRPRLDRMIARHGLTG